MNVGEGSGAGCREKRQIEWEAEAERSADSRKKRRNGQGSQAVMDFVERPLSHNFSRCLQLDVSSQSQMEPDVATTSLGTFGSRAWLLEWGANCFRWVADLQWWIANHFRCVANHMSQLAKPAAGCEPRLEKSTIAKQLLLPAQPHGQVPMHFDVFLNHRGPDVKGAFVAHLHHALKAEGLNPFLDKYSLAPGGPAFASIDTALEMAKVHVAVVSVGYADSKHCLRELVAMLRSGKPVIPVFYDVEPAELRRMETGAFAAAFKKHRSREEADEVREWADALGKLADITASVFRSSDYRGDEAELKQDVVDAVVPLVPRFRPLQVEKYLVGLEGHLEACVSAVNAMSDTRSVLGLFGMGGVGKTCLAKVVYNHLIFSGEFKAACFLEIGQTLRSSKKSVKLGWLQSLQAQLLWDLLHLGEEKQKRQGYEYWFDKLSNQGRVLIVLDDIQDKDHFDKLIPIADALAEGSCIIATSRDRHLLNLISYDDHFLKRIDGNAKFYLHEVTPLGREDSVKLLKWHVFGGGEPPEKFKTLLSGVSQKYGGLPLALKVVGCGLHGKTSYEEQQRLWPEAMEALLGYVDIKKALEWSYDCLSESERLMFVDIAFLCCGWKKDDTLRILESCRDCSSCCGNKSPYTSLDHLIDKSLVTLDYNIEINMHALVQELGLNIGKEKGSHLVKKVTNFRVQNGEKVRALRLVNYGGVFEVNVEKFKEMPNLHFLVMNECVLYGNSKDIFEEVRYLQLRNCTIEHQPFISELINLVTLDLAESLKLTGSDFSLEGCPNLLDLDLGYCDWITSLPYSIGHLSRLERLNLNGCSNLQKLPDSMNDLTSLRVLKLMYCESLVALPKFITHLKWSAYGCEVTWKNSPPTIVTICNRNEEWWFVGPPDLRGAIKINLNPVIGFSEFAGLVNNSISGTCKVVADFGTLATEAMLRHLTLPFTSSPLSNIDKVEQILKKGLGEGALNDIALQL